jgi:dienelactone hydrolase
MQQSDVTIESAGEQLAGWLYRPDGDGPHPILVMAHGFSAVRDQRLDAYAERFVGAGIGVLLFDYRYFGDSSGQPRQLLDIKAQLADWRRAVAHARTVDWADTGRLALFGSSFSGGHVVAIAADDPGVAAVVSQAPFHDVEQVIGAELDGAADVGPGHRNRARRGPPVDVRHGLPDHLEPARLPDPDDAPSSMVTSPSGAWTSYCVLGSGMDGGTVRLYRSDDAGRRWALTAAANAEGHRVGSVGDSPASLSSAGTERSSGWSTWPTASRSAPTAGGTGRPSRGAPRVPTARSPPWGRPRRGYRRR